MSRKIVALAALALTGALLVVPDPSSARGGGMRGGFHGLRPAVFLPRAPRSHLPGPRLHAQPIHFDRPVPPRTPPLLARTTVRAPFVHLARRSHGAYIYGSTYPITGDDEAAYYGMPYDPGAAIPVYGPAPLIQDVDPPPPPRVPRLSSMRDENGEACRSERVTVPAAEGEREIAVVRC
jgi:hypothetical protein